MERDLWKVKIGSAIGHASIVPSALVGFDVLVTGPDGKTVKRFHAETEASARATVAEEYPTVIEPISPE